MIRRALLSVSDKTNLLDLARALAARGVELLSTGGTYKALAGAGIAVTTVEAYTGSPEVMDGRVKTLHPRVHGGILMRGAVDDADLDRLGGKPIDLVVVNLYPFAETVARASSSHDDIVENIDIGGPSMVRSAAKNHARVTVVCDPADYAEVMAAVEASGEVPLATRKRLAAKAFAHTAAYDGMVAAYLSSADGEAEPRRDERYPRYLSLTFERLYTVRYGENPHQTGAFYSDRSPRAGSVAAAESLGAGGKELSFNNVVDVDAAWEAVREHERPAAVVVKHTNPCGVAVADDITAAYTLARDADATSAFGGIVALNRSVGATAARALAETFLECIIAPSFDEEALAILRAKKNLRLLAAGVVPPAGERELTWKRVGGGLVIQDRDATAAGEVKGARVATRRAPTADEIEALDFAWRVAKHVKSNAIVLARGGRAGEPLVTVGVGAGQMSRVESVKIACGKAGDRARGAVLASDAFFPFPDGLELALSHGVVAAAQPGGSVKDADVIEAADRAGAAMVLTGARHFRH